MRIEDLNRLWASACIDEAVQGGALHAVVCPGSRSGPLALACIENPQLNVWSVVDERSAAFFALGLAKETGRPSVLVCTSGSAGAHFLPALIEASLGQVPLLVLTADRPWELHGFGAAQTIAQGPLFGPYVRHRVELGVAELGLIPHLRATVARTMNLAREPARGPVHLNVPFREPLVAPGPGAAAAAEPTPRFVPSRRVPEATALQGIRERVAAVERGLIVCGPLPPNGPLRREVIRLARSWGYPVLAEAASNLRQPDGPVVAHYDLLLRHQVFAEAHRPEFVLRLGGGLTSKVLQRWLDEAGADTVVLSEADQLTDPGHSATEFILGDPLTAMSALGGEALVRSGTYQHSFLFADRLARQALRQAWSGSEEVTEPRAAVEVVAALRTGANLFVSSSMPIRDLDGYVSALPEEARVFANRAVNGIDGITSTALGVAAASTRPTVLLTGDLALLHDLSGLLVARRHRLSLCVVVINNEGGGIFSFLPVASSTPHFERLFATPHEVDLSHVAAMCGANHHRVELASQLRREVQLAQEGGLHLIEVRTERRLNVEAHLRLHARVAEALGAGPWQ